MLGQPLLDLFRRLVGHAPKRLIKRRDERHAVLAHPPGGLVAGLVILETLFRGQSRKAYIDAGLRRVARWVGFSKSLVFSRFVTQLYDVDRVAAAVPIYTLSLQVAQK